MNPEARERLLSIVRGERPVVTPRPKMTQAEWEGAITASAAARMRSGKSARFQCKPGGSKALALTRKCPTCGSPIGVNCARDDGTERKTPHKARAVSRSFAKLRKRYPAADEFYLTDEWRAVRYQALRKHGGACQCCGQRATPRAPLHVDHIKPRSRFPELALDLNNLQVLCADCNLGKRASDTTDWRV